MEDMVRQSHSSAKQSQCKLLCYTSGRRNTGHADISGTRLSTRLPRPIRGVGTGGGGYISAASG